MNELIAALTRAANAVAAYYEEQLGLDPTPAADPHLTAAEATGAKKTRKPRVTKAAELEVPPAAPPAAVPPAAAATPAIPEGEALTECYKIAAAYVNKDTVEANVAARQMKAREHMDTTYKVKQIKDLSYPQKLAMVEWFRAQLAAPAAV